MSGTSGPRPESITFVNTKSIPLDGVDDFVNVGDSNNLSFGDGTNDSPFSISTWVKMTDTTRFYILNKGLVFSTNYEYLLNTNASDKLGLYLYDSSNNSRIGRIYNTPLTTYQNQWVHICSTYNGSGLSSGIKIYLNGVRVDDTDSNSGTYVAMENGDRNLNIGRTETGLYSDGNIDETSVFNSELSASDVTAIYNNGTPTALFPYKPLSWWRMGDGDTSPTLLDHGREGNNGTMTNFSTFSTDVPTTFNTRSIALDGVDDYVSTGLNLSYTTYPNVSFSCWIKMDKASLNTFTSYSPTGAYVNTYPNSSPIRIYTDGSKNAYVRVQGNGTSNTTTDLADGNWHHIVQTCRYETSGTVCNVYIDGVQEITNQLFLSYSQITGDFFVGARNATTQFFVGGIDEVAVFDSELTQSDITDIYNSGVPTSLSSYSPIAWYRCGDGDTAPTLTDNGSGGNDGTMTNFTTFSTDVPTASPFTNTKSIALDGVDDTVSISSLPSTFTNLSISFWLKKGVDAFNAYVFARSTSQWIIFQNGANNSLKYRLITNGGTYTKIGGAILDSQWHHCAFVWDSSANTFDIYEDGVKIGTSTTTSGSLISSTDTAYIFSATNGAPYSSGNLDELAIFDSVLSQTDITSIYNGGVPNDIASLSPLSWWRMGDGDTSPTLTDNGSGGNDGTMTNFSTFSTDVPPTFSKRSISLDGVDDYVDCGDNDNLSFGNGVTDSPFSVSTWVKMDNIAKFRAVGKYGASNIEYVLATGGDSKLIFNCYDNSEGSRIGRKYFTPMNSYQGQWIHIVGTYNGNSSSSGLKIYINGTRVDDTDSNLGTYVAMENTIQPLYIGKLTTSYSDGLIDETAIFNSELSASDVTSIYNGGVPNDISSLNPLSWWRCGDSDTSPTLTDNGSGGNDGTMTNFTTFSTDVPT